MTIVQDTHDFHNCHFLAIGHLLSFNKFSFLEEILHQLIGSLSHCLQGFLHVRWCRISSINSRDAYWMRFVMPKKLIQWLQASGFSPPAAMPSGEVRKLAEIHSVKLTAVGRWSDFLVGLVAYFQEGELLGTVPFWTPRIQLPMYNSFFPGKKSRHSAILHFETHSSSTPFAWWTSTENKTGLNQMYTKQEQGAMMFQQPPLCSNKVLWPDSPPEPTLFVTVTEQFISYSHSSDISGQIMKTYHQTQVPWKKEGFLQLPFGV